MNGITTKPEMRCHVRWMIRRDMDEVITTEALSHPRPWTWENFEYFLKKRNCIGMVAEKGDDVIAHVVYELHRNRLHLLNLAVHPAFRRHGVGSQVITKLIDKLSTHGRRQITVEVPEGYLAGQLFFRQMRFLATNIIRHDDGDLYRMAFIRDESSQ